MRGKLKIFLCFFLVGMVSGPLLAQETDSDPMRVLFVGNSYTYFWNLPQTVEAMAHSQEVALVARKSTAGGTNWKQHWEGDKGLETRKIIKEGEWDVVILQNHSRSTLDDLEQFMEYGNKLIELVNETGAKPVLYETWSRAYNPLMINQIKEGYHALADRHQLEVVHIGEIWDMALELRPDLRLYDPDQSHPSTIGAYLTACAFYSHLTGNSVDPLDERISKTDGDGELLYLSIMSEDDANFLQELVDTFNKRQEDE